MTEYKDQKLWARRVRELEQELAGVRRTLFERDETIKRLGEEAKELRALLPNARGLNEVGRRRLKAANLTIRELEVRLAEALEDVARLCAAQAKEV